MPEELILEQPAHLKEISLTPTCVSNSRDILIL